MTGSTDEGIRTWCGRSGRRYAVEVYPVADPILRPDGDLVALAVERMANGIARLVAVATFTPGDADAKRFSWAAWAKSKGADEIHLHRFKGPDPHAAVSDLEPS